MYMFTSYGHIRTRNKITDFFMILAWASPFNSRLNVFNQLFYRLAPMAHSIRLWLDIQTPGRMLVIGFGHKVLPTVQRPGVCSAVYK